MPWTIDAVHSQVAFSIRHLMVSTARGRFNVLRGSINIDEENLAQSWIEAEVDAANVDTGDAQRDAHLRSADFFDVEKYPTITFKSTKVEHIDGPDYKVTGDFTMHGVTRPVTFNVEYAGQSNMMGQRAGLTARARINRKDWGLSFGSVAEAGQVALSETVNIEIDLEVIYAAEAVQETAAS
jgi:polyisoprenoid-binding protein YceI